MGLLSSLILEKIKENAKKSEEDAKVKSNLAVTSLIGNRLQQVSGDPTVNEALHKSIMSQDENGKITPVGHTVDSSKTLLDYAKGQLTIAQRIKNDQARTMLQTYGEQPVSKINPVPTDEPTTNVGGTDFAAIPGITTPHQDLVASQAIQRISSARGDASLVRTELQRDAAAQGFNTIAKAEAEKRPLSQLEYYDTLGQMWRAKTGTAPTTETMAAIDGKTLEQKLNNFGTFITGKPQAANSPEIISNLKNYIQDTGEQLDRAHDRYMAPHLIRPPGISDETWAPIISSSRGLTFKDATDLVTIKNPKTGQVKRVSRQQAKDMGAL